MRTPHRSILVAGLVLSASAAAQPAPPAPAPTPAVTAGAPEEPAVAAATPAPPSHAWQIGVAPRFGLVAPTSKLGLMVIGGLQVDYVLPALDHRLLVGIDASLTRPSHDGTVMDPRLPSPGTYTIHETELVLALLASYRLAPADRSLVPWVGAGPLLHLLRTTETTSLAPGDNTASSTKPGVELAGGADFRTGPGFLGGDVRVVYSGLDDLLTGSTNAGKITVAVSYRLVF